MDYQVNEKYFTAKGTNLLFIIGLVLAAIGAFCVYMFWELNFIGIILVAAGLVLIFVSSGKKIKDGDIDDAVARESKSFEEAFVDKFITDHSRSSGLKVSDDSPKPKRRGKPEYFGCYWFSSPKYIKRGGDGITRSSTYCCAGILIDPEQLSIGRRLFSLVASDTNDVWETAPFAALEKAELVEPVVNEASRSAVRYTMLRITKKDGSLFAEIPLTADAGADKAAADINQSIARF